MGRGVGWRVRGKGSGVVREVRERRGLLGKALGWAGPPVNDGWSVEEMFSEV